MKRLFIQMVAVSGFGALAACGGGGGGGFAGGDLEPVFALDPGPGLIGLDQKIDESLTDPTRGATGYVVVYDQFSPNPQIRELKIGLSPDRTQITVTIAGVTSETVSALGSPSNLGGTYGENPPINGTPLVSTLHSFNTGIFSYKKTTISGSSVDDTTAQGVYGIETPYDRVPTSASYSGTLDGFGIPTLSSPVVNGVNGNITLNLTGTSVAGTFAGTTQVDGDSGAATGSLSGSVSDNILSGTLSIVGTESSYSGNFVAKFYGYSADDVAGVWEGTVTPVGGATQQAYGSLEAD